MSQTQTNKPVATTVATAGLAVEGGLVAPERVAEKLTETLAEAEAFKADLLEGENETQRLIREAKWNLRSPDLWVKQALHETRGTACLIGGFQKAGMAAKTGAWVHGDWIRRVQEANIAHHEARKSGGFYQRDWWEGGEDNFIFQCDAAPFVSAAIGELFPDRPTTPHHFNDAHATTHADVMAVLDRAYVLAATKKED